MIYTTIFLLIDTRPEVVAAGYPNGIPFYCGKTERNAHDLDKHLRRNAIVAPMRQTSQMLMTCEGTFQIEMVQAVTEGQSWKTERGRWRKWVADNFPQNDTVQRHVSRFPMSEGRRKMIGDGVRRRQVKNKKVDIKESPY